jgi:hypothetical protein
MIAFSYCVAIAAAAAITEYCTIYPIIYFFHLNEHYFFSFNAIPVVFHATAKVSRVFHREVSHL